MEGAGLLEVPESANGRGLREAGVLPDCGPGLADAAAEGMGAAAMAAALAEGELGALYLLGVDPLRSHPDRPRLAGGADRRPRSWSPTPPRSPKAWPSTPT